MTGHPEFYRNFVPGLDKFNFIAPDWAHKTTPIKKQLQTLRFVGIIYLVRTQSFPKNEHFLLLCTHTSHFHDGARYHIETSPLICGAERE